MFWIRFRPPEERFRDCRLFLAVTATEREDCLRLCNNAGQQVAQRYMVSSSGEAPARATVADLIAHLGNPVMAMGLGLNRPDRSFFETVDVYLRSLGDTDLVAVVEELEARVLLRHMLGYRSQWPPRPGDLFKVDHHNRRYLKLN